MTQLLGTDAGIQVDNFTLYPNPANQLLSVSCSFFGNEDVSVIISDFVGKEIYSGTSKNSEKIEVDIKDFPVGVYLARVQTRRFSQMKKLVIAR